MCIGVRIGSMLHASSYSSNGRPCGWVSAAHRLAHADLCGYEELLHGHRVHVGEVLRHKLLAIVPVAEAIVLLEIDGELSDHDRVLDVRLNPLQSFDALVAGVLLGSLTDSSSLTNVKSSIHEIVFHNGVQHADVVSGEALSAEVLVVAKSGAVCVPDVVMNVDSSHLDHVTKLVHLVHALAAQKPWFRSSHGTRQKREKEDGPHFDLNVEDGPH